MKLETVLTRGHAKIYFITDKKEQKKKLLAAVLLGWAIFQIMFFFPEIVEMYPFFFIKRKKRRQP